MRVTILALVLAGALAAAPAAATITIQTDTTWRATGAVPGAGWNTSLGYDDSDWGFAVQSPVHVPAHYWAPSFPNTAYLRKEFELTGTVLSGLLTGGVDDDAIVFINGVEVMRDLSGASSALSANIGAHLVGGWNLIAVQAIDRGGPEGFRAALTIETATTAVPEPATWVMMIVGFGLAGAAMRRRSSVAFA